MRISNATVVCFLLVASLGRVSGSGDIGAVEIPTGSSWTYSYNETVHGSSETHLSIDGTWRYSCLGLADAVTGSNGSQAVEFYSVVKANVSGTVVEYDYFGHLLQITVAGTLKAFEYSYYDLESGLPISVTTNRVLDVRNSEPVYGHSTLIYSEEHNQTNYTSVRTSPPDLATYTDFSSLIPGTNWTVEYSGFANSTGVEGTKYVSNSSMLDETINYTYIGQESVKVAAGTFDCSKIRHADQDYNVTEWYCPEIGSYAKIVTSTTGDETVNSLISYHLEEETVSDGAIEKHDLTMLLLSGVLAVSVVAVTVALYLWKRKRPPVSQTAPQPEEMKLG